MFFLQFCLHGGLKRNDLLHQIEKAGDLQSLVSEELQYLKSGNSKLANKLAWRIESIHMILWVLGGIKDLGLPTEVWQTSIKIEKQLDIIHSGTYRSTSEILDMLDLLYRLDWACTDLRIKNTPTSIVNYDVLYEWRYVLEWIVYSDQNWDEVAMDT